MKLLSFTRFELHPWQTHGPTVLTEGVDPTPKPPTISVEFTHSEYMQLLVEVLGTGCMSDELRDALVDAGMDAGLVVEDDDEIA